MTARLRITDREGRYEAIRREKEGVWPRFAGPTTVITGLSFDRERLWELPKQEKNGGNRYELELFMEGRSVEIEEGGTYEIIMPGMEGVLTFPMKKADTYEALQEIGDCDMHGNKAILAFAGKTKEGVTVRTYTYSSDGTRVLPVPLLYGMTGEDGIRLEIGNHFCPWDGKYQEGEAVFTGVGISDGTADSDETFRQGSAMLFSDAEVEMDDRLVLSIPGLLFETDEESEEITIPIPGERGEQAADGKAEFAYAEVGIESAETFKEPKEEVLEAIYPITVILSDTNGRKLSTKTLSVPKKLKINLAVRNRDRKTELYDLICERSVKQTGHADANGWQENEKIRDAETGAVTGYLIPYREGDREVKIRFRHPVFYYGQRFRIPLEADGIAGLSDDSPF